MLSSRAPWTVCTHCTQSQETPAPTRSHEEPRAGAGTVSGRQAPKGLHLRFGDTSHDVQEMRYSMRQAWG